MKFTITLFATLFISVGFGSFGGLAYAAETESSEQTILEEVPEAVRTANTLSPEEEEIQRAAIQKATAEFESAAAAVETTPRQ